MSDPRAELAQLRATIEYAYAMGHGCSIGDHPRYQAVRDRERRLLEQIHEQERAA